MRYPMIRSLGRLCSMAVSALVMAAIALMLGACGGGGGSGTDASNNGAGNAAGGGSTPTLTPYTLQASGAPIDVTVSLDASRAASALLPLAGGSISATGADGTRYTLVVPDNALVEPTRITLTPVQEVNQLPIGETGRTQLGVQLEPSGLRFMNPATLHVEPAATSAVPLDKQLFVQWQNDGRQLALASPETNSTEIRLKVLHFSGMGVVRSKGFDADIESVRQRIGGEAERRIQSVVAELMMRERQRLLLGGLEGAESERLQAQFSQLVEQFEREVLQPRLAAAGSSCAAAKLAWNTAVALERMGQLLGIVGLSGTAAIAQAFSAGAEVCMKEEFEICRDEHVITRILPKRLGLSRVAQLLGMEDNFPAADRYLRACLKFELDYQSTARFDSQPLSMEEVVEAFTLRLASDNPGNVVPVIKGSGALRSVSYTGRSSDPCAAVQGEVRVGGTYSVKNLSFTFNGEAVADFHLELDPEANGSQFQPVDICAPITPLPRFTVNWSGVEWPVRIIKAPDPAQAFVISGWNVQPGSAVIATKTETLIHAPGANTVWHVNDRWELRHTPAL